MLPFRNREARVWTVQLSHWKINVFYHKAVAGREYSIYGVPFELYNSFPEVLALNHTGNLALTKLLQNYSRHVIIHFHVAIWFQVLHFSTMPTFSVCLSALLPCGSSPLRLNIKWCESKLNDVISLSVPHATFCDCHSSNCRDSSSHDMTHPYLSIQFLHHTAVYQQTVPVIGDKCPLFHLHLALLQQQLHF